LQGTQSRCTKANLAKEPALFQRFRGHNLLRWTQTFNSNYQGEGRTYNMGIAKMQADGSRVSTFVILLGCISNLTLSIELCAYHHLFYLYSAAVSRADGILFPALRQYLAVACKRIRPSSVRQIKKRHTNL